MSRRTRLLGMVAGVLLLSVPAFSWVINRIYVPEGYSLQLRYKGPLLTGERNMARTGYWAAEGEVGVLERLRGPGRHFYCPIWWERELVPDVVIKPGEIGVVTCKLGDPLPDGGFLVDGEIGDTKNKGILRKVLGPGRYRINPYGYEVKVSSTEKLAVNAKSSKVSGWVNIPTGYVGVVTNLADNLQIGQKQGIQDKVLPPGLYPTNPREQQVDVVGVGYWETSVQIETKSVKGSPAQRTDDQGEPIDTNLKGGINFPSSDGFNIVIDFTAVWGLMPDQAAKAIRTFGNIEMIENKVILPQIESIVRNNGSEYPAVKMLVGHEREEFQDKTLRNFQEVLKVKDISVQYGLVRHIYIPKEVREPIQLANVADELKITREQEQETARTEGDFRESERKVDLESARVVNETRKLVAERLAEGQKSVGETEAGTRRLVAAIDRETAELESQARIITSGAENDGKKLIEEAKASRFKLAVKAFGTPTAFNNWSFANSLPENIELKLFYAGPGTMWTDLKDALRIMVPGDAKPTAMPVPKKE